MNSSKPMNSHIQTQDKTANQKHKGVLYVVAKVIRVMTIPPMMVGGLLLLLTYFRPDVITNDVESFMSLLFLAIIPILAYPVSAMVPSIKAKSRGGQRNLAFVFSVIGYLGGVIYGALAGVSESLMVIFGTYFLSVIVLTILNKVIKVKASGHACSIAGPIGLVCYFLPTIFIPISLLAYAAIFWASVHMGRHTVREFIYGSISSPASLLVVALLSVIF